MAFLGGGRLLFQPCNPRLLFPRFLTFTAFQSRGDYLLLIITITRASSLAAEPRPLERCLEFALS